MSRSVPIYRNHDGAFQADTCQPLVEAAHRHQVRLEALVHGHYPGRHLPSRALPGLKTVGFWDAVEDQTWGLDWHRNEGIELTFRETGHLAFAVEEQQFDLEPDDLTVTWPWQRHRVGRPNVGAGRLHWLIVDVAVRRPNQNWIWPPWFMLSEPDRHELTNLLRHTEQPVWKATQEMRRCFQAIGHAVESDDAGSDISRLTVRLNELFVLLLDMLRKRKICFDASLSSTRRTVQLFLADLRAHADHLALEWSVQEMASSCGLGITQFVHHVKALTNLTPMHYLNHCRLDLAAKLLREEAKTGITEIALRCGFSSGQYFATAFARRFGRPPREYRPSR